MSLLNLSRKAKILILVAWVLLLASVVLITLAVCNQEKNYFNTKSFSDNPSDKYMNVKITMKENRKSSYESDNLENHLETSTYDFEILIGKNSDINDKELDVKYINTVLTIETINGEFIVKENRKGNPTGSSSQMSRYTYTSLVTFSSLAKKNVQNSSSNVETIDQTPKYLYIEMHYVVDVKDKTSGEIIREKNVLKYKATVEDISQIKTPNEVKELSEVVVGEDTYVIDEDGLINVVIEPTLTKGETTDLDIYYDSIKLQLSPVTTNLNPIIDFEIIGIIVNDKYDINEDFVNKVLLGSVHGALQNKYSDWTIKIDECYKLSQIQIIGKVVLPDGTVQSRNYIVNLK